MLWKRSLSVIGALSSITTASAYAATSSLFPLEEGWVFELGTADGYQNVGMSVARES